MKEKIRLTLISALVIWIHLYIYNCVNCSKIFIWWNDLNPTFDISFIALIFSVLIFIFVALSIFNTRKHRLIRLLGIFLVILSLVSVVYWIYVLITLKFAFFLQYFLLILIHLGLIGKVFHKIKKDER